MHSSRQHQTRGTFWYKLLPLLFTFGCVIYFVSGFHVNVFATGDPHSFMPNSSSDVFLSEAEKADTLATSSTTRLTMYRLYNRYTGEHFYTSSSTEKKGLVDGGWTDEGIGWYAPSKSSTPVYRLYNPYVSGGDHHYTTNIKEYNSLGNSGWKKEGVGWYSSAKGEADAIALYRQYNPYAKTGTHNYTKDKSENDSLVKKGWKAEGVGWYGYSELTKAIDFAKAKVDTTAKTYTGTQLKPSAGIAGLKAGTDYTVTYGANKNAGIGTITIKGKGLYTGSKTYKFKINPQNINFAKAVVDTSDKTYSAQNIKPQASVSGLTANKDYAVSYGENKNAGTTAGKITISGKGNYTGTKTYTFNINQKTVTTVTWSATNFEYNGNEQGPSASANEVCNGDTVKVSVEGTRKDTGNFVARATSVDNVNYKLSPNIQVDCQILQKEVTVNWKDLEFTYDAQEHAPTATFEGVIAGESVNATVGGAKIDASGDLTYTAYVGELDNANYCYADNAKKSVEFTIQQFDITNKASVTLDKNDFVYDSTEKTQTVKSVVAGSFTLDASKDFDVFGDKAKNAGTHEITITGKGNFTGSATSQFNIARKDISSADITLKSTLTYNGDEQTQDLESVEVETLELNASTDYLLSNNKGTNADTYTLKVEGKGNFKGYKTKDFKIGKREVTIASFDASNKPYDGTATASGTATLNNVVAKDSGKVEAVVTGTFASVDASSEKIDVNVSVTGISGDAVGNYNLASSASKATQAYIMTAVHFNTNCKADLEVASAIPNSSLGETQDPSATLTTKRADDGVKLEGWYSNEACTDGSTVYGVATENKKWDFATNTVSGNEVTLYANWVVNTADASDAQKYWIQPSYKVTIGNTDATVSQNNSGYVKDGWNVKKSSKDIVADVASINAGDTNVKSEYQAYLDNDDYHLFTKWNGSQAQYGESTSTTHTENQYVEFRLIEVGNHNDGNGNKDALTFQATHALPTALQMKSKNANSGGWYSTTLYTALNSSSGSVYSKFNSGFVSAIRKVSKSTTTGSKSKSTSTSTNTFWLASRVEMSNVGTLGFKDEGKQYAYFSGKSIQDVSYNPCLTRKTRAGATAGSSTTKLSGWWERSPRIMDGDSFVYVEDNGTPSDNYGASQYLGVVPCFCF